MKKRLIECVPNFSEGRNRLILDSIADSIREVEGVRLLNIDPGEATNRTVYTFVGEPELVVDAAFRAVKRASELIDMRHHKGAHPRIGATDVLPLIPISGVTIEECANLACNLAQRIAHELQIPTYNYEAAALRDERRNLAVCRAGEYEGLAKKITTQEGMPDWGVAEFTEQAARSGATVVGARDFLVAVNFNLNTTSTRRANAIAFDVREKGRPMREGNPITGKIVKDADGNPVMIPGTLKGCKAIGWYIDEYQMAQVSMNITNISQTSLHEAFEEVSRASAERGVRVTGTEIVGLVPKSVLVEAGRHFLRKQQRSLGVTEAELIRIAILSMNLSQLRTFDPQEKIIEYLLEDQSKQPLIKLSCREFAETTASESPAPGGGSVSAYMGSLAAALGAMVANLSAHKAGWDQRWEEFSDWAEKGQALMAELLYLVDEDTASFNRIMEVFAMPKTTAEEKNLRSNALQEATLYATQIPLRTMEKSLDIFPLLKAMVEHGNPNSITDAGVGALAARAAIHGAHLNVRINAAGLHNKTAAAELLDRASSIAKQADLIEQEIMALIDKVIV